MRPGLGALRGFYRNLYTYLSQAGIFQFSFWAFPVALSVLLGVISQYDFLIFHTLAEFFAIAVAMVMFALAWHTSPFSRNKFLLFLACGYFWVGGLDMLHMLSYKGLNLLKESGGNTSSQFWIVTRYCEALLLLLAPFASGFGLKKTSLFYLDGFIAVALGLVVWSGYFPVTFVEGQGLTGFKIYSEYVVIAMLAVAAILLFRRRANFQTEEVTLLIVSIFLTMLAEFSFTRYNDTYGLANLVGHVFKIFSYWTIFRAIVAFNLRKPYVDLQNTFYLAEENRKAAERANQAKSDFLSMMSHDLRTPLNAIMGFSDILKLETFGPLGSPRYSEYAVAIHSSGKHLVHLINDLLDVSKIESGTYRIDQTTIELAPLLGSVQLAFEAEGLAQGNHIILDIPPGAPGLLADNRAFTQIVYNLVGNAIKFSDVGADITVSWLPSQGSAWMLRVADSGCGIDPAKLARITEPFFQGDPHVSRRNQGVGLGLHIVKTLVELHGAELVIDSTVGVGTTVSVVFPASKIVDVPAAVF